MEEKNRVLLVLSKHQGEARETPHTFSNWLLISLISVSKPLTSKFIHNIGSLFAVLLRSSNSHVFRALYTIDVQNQMVRPRILYSALAATLTTGAHMARLE